jgi:predicted nuclease of restriction endonuclease-like (RecB) superfamily
MRLGKSIAKSRELRCKKRLFAFISGLEPRSPNKKHLHFQKKLYLCSVFYKNHHFKIMPNLADQEQRLFETVAALIHLARQKVATTINLAMVHTYFEIGREIVEVEQQGESRAAYGKHILSDLSVRLTEQFGRGFSVQNLRNMRQFFTIYQKRSGSPIRQKPSSELINYNLSAESKSFFTLSWSHYLVLMRIENEAERSFYEIEATKQMWSEPQLKRQYHSSLYERLALSRDKTEVMRLANEGQMVEKANDILKDPLSLEFLGLETHSAYSESDLEQAIIAKLQHFLLELGKGFLFEARQKRFSFDERHFFVDLVFYNRLLQCYVLIDLKTDELVHQDLGQMQMYVNYYDRFVKLDHEKPTIGILLCKAKSDTLVELTLPTDANIYAAAYSLYLPDKAILQQKLAQWIAEFEQ